MLVDFLCEVYAGWLFGTVFLFLVVAAKVFFFNTLVNFFTFSCRFMLSVLWTLKEICRYPTDLHFNQLSWVRFGSFLQHLNGLKLTRSNVTLDGVVRIVEFWKYVRSSE